MLDWGTIAALTIAVAAILGIIIQWAKKDKPWHKGQTDLTIRITTMENKVESMNESLDTIKHMVELHEMRDGKDFDRVESKIEKLTELMIKIISQGKLDE